jgi:Endo-alpha-N-acetylgalactosaminidase
MRYALEGSSLIATIESVKEQAGFELIEFALPQMMCVREEDGPAWMAEGRRGGSFVRLEASKSFRFPDNEYFGRISTELPVGMVGRSGIGCLMEVTAFHDGTETEIKGDPGHHHATLGCVMTHRVHGGRCYSMNDAGSPICGNSKTPNLIVGQMPRIRFDFFSCAEQKQPWLTGAKIMRSRMPPSPTEYLSDRFLYIVAGKRKIDPEPKTTFAQSKALVHDIAMLTDFAPQVALISGFAYDGQDTGFPSEDKINSSLGTDEELRALIQSSKELNANVTLNVNYDDAYKSSPLFDHAFIARRPDGEIWKSRAWDGEDSYVVGMAKYMQGGWGSKRIAFTVDHFKIKDTLLIDAMSWFAVRNDWDPQHPASGYKNLIEGKFKIIDEFRRRGIAVTSEQLRYPMIGHLAETMDGPGISNRPFGGEAVPMLSTIYRGAAIWGGSGARGIRPGQELFWNTRSSLWFQADTDRTLITDFYYLVVLPFSKLHRLSVEEYENDGTTRHIQLEQRSMVKLSGDERTYTAIFRGTEIANDDATYCPIDDHRIAFYSRTARRLEYSLPPSWNQAQVVARTMTLEGPVATPVQFINGNIVVDTQPKRPIIVYASEGAVRKT